MNLNSIPLIGRFVGENYTTKVGLWRRRGDTFVFELHDAVRYRYEGRPNAHILDTGEEIPAVALNNVYTMNDGTPYFEAVEIEDGQYAPRQKALNKEEVDPDDLKASVKEMDGEIVPLKAEIDRENLEDSIIQNKDQRLNFWLDHYKESEEKYNVKSLISEHMNIILIVVSALAIGIIFYTSPISTDTALNLVSDLITQMETLNGNFETYFEQNPDINTE